MNEAVKTLIEEIKKDYVRWTYQCAKGELSETNKKMIANFEEGVRFEEGRKYIKVLTDTSVWGFIVAVEDDKKFNKGDILMPASYNSPARNKARGNVFDLENYATRWVGANYL